MSDNPLKPLNDGQVEGVAGGYLFYVDGEPDTPYEVLDDKGNVIERFSRYSQALWYAKKNGYSVEELSWNQLKRLRETGTL